MTRNNADFQGGRSTLFHVAPKSKRESIEEVGLIPRTPKLTIDEAPAGVYLSQGVPNAAYGDDVYVVRRTAGMRIRVDPTNDAQRYSPDIIYPSSISRVGHIYRRPDGHPEVHLHPEEQCSSA